ncbi:MAG: PRC-barrel domain-containing protein [Phycisphaerales bacterium]
MNMKTSRLVALACIAGLACSVAPALAQKQPIDPKMPSRDAAAEHRRALSYFTTLKGSNLMNEQDESVAEVRDVIFDRHSGDIAAYVVSSSWFGWGGTARILFPDEVKYSTGDDGKVTLRANIADKDALKGRMTFDEKVFDSDKDNNPHTEWWNRFTSESGKMVGNTAPSYEAEKITSTTPTEVKGTVTSVDRERGKGQVYSSVIEVRDRDGSTRKIIIAPAWYLSDHDAMPMRGQTVTVKAVPIEERHGAKWAACRLDIDGGKSVELRKGDNWSPAWYNGEISEESMAVQRRLVLGSKVIGKEVKCREELSGEVENLVLDHAGDRVVAYVIDPNEAFLGIGDTTRLIPVSVASPRINGAVYVDATKDMILKAPAAPTNLSDLNNRWELDQVFEQRPIRSRR